MIVDGKLFAEDIVLALEKERARFAQAPRLGILLGGDDPVLQSFVRVKHRLAERLRVEVVREELPPEATTADAVAAVKRLIHDTHGIIVQLPLPPGIDVETVIAAIPFDRDVDAINEHIPEAKRRVHGPVAEAILEILSRVGVDVRGKRVVVVGDGRLVGKPSAHALRGLGAKVSVVTHTQGSLSELQNADVVVSGAGEPGLITPDLIHEGAVLIDAGTSEASGKLSGDAEPSCAAKASVFTPVPGGVGPVAVAMIFKNLFQLAQTPLPK